MNLFSVLLDVSDGIANSADLLSLVIGDRNAELLLKFHDELYCVQRVSTQIVCEACFRLNISLVYTKFINDDCLYF